MAPGILFQKGDGMQIDWKKSEWQCVRMVVDQLINQVTELAKQLQDSRRQYGDAVTKINDKDFLISVLQNGIAMYKRKEAINLMYIEKLRDILISSGTNQNSLDEILEEIADDYDGKDD